MNESDLTKLKPAEQTGVEIRASLGRIASARTSVQSRINDTRAEMLEKEAAFALTSAARRKFSDQIADLESDLAMLASLATQTETPLANVELIERDARLGADRVAIMAEMETLDRQWKDEYPALHAALAKLLAGRAKLVARAEDHIFETINIFKPIDLAEFCLPTDEVHLLKTPAKRAYDAIPDWLHETRSLAAANEARRVSREANTPRVMDDKPQPTLTVGGVVQAMPGRGW